MESADTATAVIAVLVSVWVFACACSCWHSYKHSAMHDMRMRNAAVASQGYGSLNSV